MRTLFTALRALLYGSAFVLLWGWVALRVRALDSRFGIELPVWSHVPGIVLLAAGGILMLLSVFAFVLRGKGTPAPFDAPREFVASGPYRYVRNPMYIGGWLALVGFGLYEHSASMVAFSLAWLLLAHLFVLLYEEPNLGQRFGQSYLDYKKSVRRWIPNVN